MATSIISVFTKFFSIFILFLHLGCFTFSPNQTNNKKRKISLLSPSAQQKTRLKVSQKALSSSWLYIKRIFTSSKPYKNSSQADESPAPTLASARSSQHSIVTMAINAQEEDRLSDINIKKHSGSSCAESDISTNNDQFFPLRNDIFPCTICGEIFQKPQFLENHQAIKHAVSELLDGDSGKNIVNIIFKTGWSSSPCKEKTPKIYRILKIHNSQKILSRFEEYRELVKLKASRNNKQRDERCIADGNELLRFYCSTFTCDLGINGINTSICNQQYCSICGIIKSGFSTKMDGISTLSSSWKAHLAIPEDIEDEFSFMNVKRGMLVCRVIAGRVGCEMEVEDEVNKENGGYDSVIGRGGINGVHSRLDEEELIVFNPRAVLPCFVIVYSV